MYKFKFADIGEGLHEGGVGEIYVKVGDKVEEGDSLFSVETDKVTSDIPSPVTGKVAEILIKTGETVHVGDDVFHFETEGGAEAPAPVEEKKEEVKKEAVSEDGASVVGEVKVSNDLFNIDALSAKKSNVVSGASSILGGTAAPAQSPSSVVSTSVPKFDINAFDVKGDGEKVDAVVIGAGPGGYTVAEAFAKQGLKTVVIEKSFAGGVCLNVGCIPTKTLLKSAHVLDSIKKAAKYGIDVDYKNLSLNWNKMQERKDEVRFKLRKGVETLLKMRKVEFIIGEAEVLDRHNVKVGDRTFTTKLIILATGSSPIHLPLPGFDSPEAKKVMVDSTGALELKEIPKTMTVIGGGVIGIEFASLYQELGTQVTVLEGSPSILGLLDGDVKKVAHKFLSESGIDIKLNAKVEGFEKGSIVYNLDGKKQTIKSEIVLESIGRRPNNLGLDKTLGIKVGKRGEFIVNDQLQTSIPNIFSVGDSNALVMLAHVAYKHANIVASFVKGHVQEWDIDRMPACVFTHPELSSIGKTEEQLKADGVKYVSSVWQNVNVGKVLADSTNAIGFAKLLVGKEHGRILGAHIVNNHSSDMITEIAAIIETEGTIYELAAAVHPHPSTSEAIYEAAIHAVDKLEA